LELNGGSNGWWLAVAARNGLTDTTAIELKDAGKVDAWTAMSTTNWGFFTFQTNGEALKAPLSFRFTSKTGEQVIANNIVTSIVAGANVDTKVQYTRK